MAQPKAIVKQMTLSQFRAQFPTDAACKDYLIARRWPKGVACPRCGNPKVYVMATRAYHWQCAKCTDNGYRFSVLVGTIFENTNIPLTMWFEVIYMMMTSKNGISALQVHRVMGTGSYRTAWSMCHRIRAGMADEAFHQLTGFVEMDEAYIGGKDEWKHQNKKGGGPRGGKGKMPVIGAVQRGGKIIARAVKRMDSKTLGTFIKEMVPHGVGLLSTDTSSLYTRVGDMLRGRVTHSHKQNVVDAIHTNTY